MPEMISRSLMKQWTQPSPTYVGCLVAHGEHLVGFISLSRRRLCPELKTNVPQGSLKVKFGYSEYRWRERGKLEITCQCIFSPVPLPPVLVVSPVPSPSSVPTHPLHPSSPSVPTHPLHPSSPSLPFVPSSRPSSSPPPPLPRSSSSPPLPFPRSSPVPPPLPHAPATSSPSSPPCPSSLQPPIPEPLSSSSPNPQIQLQRLGVGGRTARERRTGLRREWVEKNGGESRR